MDKSSEDAFEAAEQLPQGRVQSTFVHVPDDRLVLDWKLLPTEAAFVTQSSKLQYRPWVALNLVYIRQHNSDLPCAAIESVLRKEPRLTRMTARRALQCLPLCRPAVTHKYQQGHLLLIVGSSHYAGAAILAGLGARATGVGMVTIAAPKSLQALLLSHLPEAIVLACPETATGTIQALPNLDLARYSAIACGCGLTEQPTDVVSAILLAHCPLILDADALNILAKLGVESSLRRRLSPTILTPHAGEFKRLFPEIPMAQKILAAIAASQASQALILFKGARTVIAEPNGSAIVITESTAALARAGSGDVLTGIIGGLLATMSLRQDSLAEIVASAAWWHSQAGILAATDRTDLGVDPLTLVRYLSKYLEGNLLEA